MLCTFGPQHGKYLYDGAGSVWANAYATKCVAMLGADADNLKKVAISMNDLIGTPSSKVLLVQVTISNLTFNCKIT